MMTKKTSPKRKEDNGVIEKKVLYKYQDLVTKELHFNKNNEQTHFKEVHRDSNREIILEIENGYYYEKKNNSKNSI